MRAFIVISALAACVTAIPHPQAISDPTAPAATIITLSAVQPISTALTPDSTSLNIPITAVPIPDPDPDNDDDDDDDSESSTSKRNPHWEPIPIFTKKCQCQLATARYPCWATDALQRCHFEENFSYGCYMQAAGGCPTPTRICSTLYKPTPRPGPHPCELAPNPPPRVTSSWAVVSSFPSLTVFPNATGSLPIVPSGNATFTTVGVIESGGV